MPQTITHKLNMVFKDELNKEFTLTLDNPNPNLTTDQVLSVMDWIIQNRIIEKGGIGLVSKLDVKIIDMTVQDLYDPI